MGGVVIDCVVDDTKSRVKASLQGLMDKTSVRLVYSSSAIMCIQNIHTSLSFSNSRSSASLPYDSALHIHSIKLILVTNGTLDIA